MAFRPVKTGRSPSIPRTARRHGALTPGNFTAGNAGFTGNTGGFAESDFIRKTEPVWMRSLPASVIGSFVAASMLPEGRPLSGSRLSSNDARSGPG
ncbi:hypothetical protein OPIT5_27790 [Opitutaceae bacterium TAV5]|nr:hypothetical protein OPIT5_27790 [Opitutaceae bacterium TAV5]